VKIGALSILALLMVAAFALTPVVAANPIRADPSFTPAYVGQSCNAHGVAQMSIGCTLLSLQAGETILVEVAEVQPPILTDSMSDHFTLLQGIPIPTSTYDVYVFSATASQSGNDLVNIAGNGNYPMMIAHGIYGATGVEDTSSGSGVSGAAQVYPFNPLSGSLVIAAALIQNNAGVIGYPVSAGPGYTMLTVGGGMVDEDAVAPGSTQTSQFVLGSTLYWAEVSVAFYPAAPTPAPQFGAPTMLVAAAGLLLLALMKRSKVLKF
jgi:hypothetical protein